MSRFASLALDTETAKRLFLRHPVTGEALHDEEGKPGYIDLLAYSSKAARAKAMEIARQRLDNGENLNQRLTPEQQETHQIAMLAACTRGWHLVGLDGKAIDISFNEQSVVELYSEPGAWYLFSQADAFANNLGNFLPASLKT